jgi:hypothetical protein
LLVTLLNPPFDELSFGIKFNADIICIWSCTSGKILFATPYNQIVPNVLSNKKEKNSKQTTAISVLFDCSYAE